MAWFAKPKTKKEQIEEQRRRRRGETVALSVHWLNFRLIFGAVLFILMALAVWFICFAGLSPVTQQLVSSQRERVRIAAASPFYYKSDVLTQQARQNASELVGPSFKQPDLAAEDHMKQAVLELESALDQYAKDTAKLSPDDQKVAREKLAREFSAKNDLDLDPADVASLAAMADAKDRNQAFEVALTNIHSLLARGIYDPSKPGFQPVAAQGGMLTFDVAGRASTAPILAQDEALRQFRINLATLDMAASAKTAIFNLLKQSITPNIVFDQERTERTKTAAMDAVKPVVVFVRKDQIVADPNAPDYDTGVQQELRQKYFDWLGTEPSAGVEASHQPLLRYLYTTLLLLAALIFIKCGLGQFERTPKAIALGCTLLLVNLVIIRLVIGIGSTGIFADHTDYLAVLPWIAPTMLAPMLATVMIGAAPAVLIALLVSMLFAMMTGDTLEVFLLNFLASLVVVYFSRDVRLRGKLVNAGLLGGLAAALCAAYLRVLNPSALTSADVGRQMFVAAFIGLMTAVAAIGLLPVFENLFKITTDITLLELTDFNHPLLRRLQMTAPGSYHHSLMVANLAERAAAEAGANPLLCRACSLYHDIGKTVKPEYFTENQRDGFNPHEEVTPSMSALIIKSHVTEGISLAKQYKLPRVVQDVIVQHHGTTLIKFFYHKASKQQRLLTQSPFGRKRAEVRAATNETATVPEDAGVDESSYRYDGPKPNFKESAIIALADCVEAASRSLRKVTPQSVEELIESIINDRIEDHQLDDSPITILELKKIKESFTFTTLNMLHSRLSYPEAEEKDASAKNMTRDPNIVAMPPPTPPPASGKSAEANGSANSASA
ncbi:MAG TPA: HDIG domain-containing protein [Opitutales bacterium]|jgi:putative nucleotidyltransferase with HDIG domain|nr:HDIG domain-containing protein [Opitutales bacterium]